MMGIQLNKLTFSENILEILPPLIKRGKIEFTVLLIINIKAPKKKNLFKESSKKPFLLTKKPIDKAIKNKIADIKKAEGNKNNPA